MAKTHRTVQVARRKVRVFVFIELLLHRAVWGLHLYITGRMLYSAKFTASRLVQAQTMLFKARSAAVYGIDAHIIDVEVDFSGLRLDKQQFSTVGLPDTTGRGRPLQALFAIKDSRFDI